MADPIFEHPRLVAIYDALDGPRDDLDLYLNLVAKFGARKILDVGCGTGSFAMKLTERGVAVVGVDPARESLEIARKKDVASEVTWVHGHVGELDQSGFDLATMTGNVAQAIADPEQWRETLSDIYSRLDAGGRLVFETRVPEREAWWAWNEKRTRGMTDAEGFGRVEHWQEVIDVVGALVTFRWNFVFDDGERLVSESTLRFRSRTEVEDDLRTAGFVIEDVVDAPDRPGAEYVFIARRG